MDQDRSTKVILNQHHGGQRRRGETKDKMAGQRLERYGVVRDPGLEKESSGPKGVGECYWRDQGPSWAVAPGEEKLTVNFDIKEVDPPSTLWRSCEEKPAFEIPAGGEELKGSISYSIRSIPSPECEQDELYFTWQEYGHQLTYGNMRLEALVILALAITCSAESNDWAWGKGSRTAETTTQDSLQFSAPEGLFEADTTGPGNYSEELVIDNILASSRQGRNLQGFDEVYSDPNVQEALQTGNDSQARHYIKERLCNLGLMACEGIEPKRPYLQPHDLIYAQPVHIKPVGQPIPAVPIRGPPHRPGYVPSRPGPPYPPRPHGPPPPVHIPRPYPPVPGPIYGSPKPVPPPVYESFEHDLTHLSPPHNKGPVEVVVNAQGNGAGSLQQHVHHHYHHTDGGVNVKPVPVPVPVPEIIHHRPEHGLLTEPGVSYGGSGSVYGNPGPVYGSPGPVYGGFGPASFGSQSPFYKKELSIKGPLSGNSLASSSNSYAERYPNYETPRADDCYCVPYDQCLPHEVGRKEDGFLIDPRNLGSNIEAISQDDVVITDENGTVISHHNKRENGANTTVEAEEGKSTVEENGEGTRVRREVSNADDKQVSPRLLGDSNKFKVNPTFGVSFGLPQGGTGGGYPLNPFGPVPALNPYGGAVGGPGGIDLGLVSVNPLLSVQVTKDEYGEKVVKPLVNLHVTPNQGLFHKIGSLFHGHKPFYGSHPPVYHHHVHKYPSPGPYRPHYHHKPFYGPPRPSYYAPDYFDYRSNDDVSETNHYGNIAHSEPADSYISDDEDLQEGYGYNSEDSPYSSYYRNARNMNGSLPSSPESSSSSSGGSKVQFPSNRRSFITPSVTRTRRQVETQDDAANNEVVRPQERQAPFGGNGRCGPRQVCCRRPGRLPNINRPQYGQCGRRNAQGINGRIKNPVYVDGDSEFGEYPWQVAILKKDTHESVYVCGGTLIDSLHVLTAAHCIKTHSNHDLRVRLGEWDVNHDVEFYPYLERDVAAVHIHPEFYAGTLYNDMAILRLVSPVDFQTSPHISPACLPQAHTDYTGSRCWTTGWGKDAFGDYGKYQNILKEVDVPIVSHHQCQAQLQQTRLGYDFKLHPGMICAGGEEGKDACKGDGGGPMVCERGGVWHVVGIVSWGIGCGQYGVPGVYVKVAHYLDWIRQITHQF
ncbi:uncharacterized protein [Anabrus simplex]|uniref:uncharacterized protein n=1 Tax=Anabrus simplex TaxID=316456 RepID=UPI0035A3635F